MKTPLLVVAVAAALGYSAVSLAALSKDERKSAENRISADYKAAKGKCKDMAGNNKDICMAQAKGANKVAKAELDARDKNTPKAHADARIARAEADHGVAKEKCDDLAGNAKDVCQKDAKAALTRAKNEAKVDRERREANKDASGRVAEARREADKDTNQAQYRAARERCDSLSGNAKDQCIAEARARYGIK